MSDITKNTHWRCAERNRKASGPQLAGNSGLQLNKTTWKAWAQQERGIRIDTELLHEKLKAFSKRNETETSDRYCIASLRSSVLYLAL